MSASTSTLSAKTLTLIDRARKLSTEAAATSSTSTILARSPLSETSPTLNFPAPTLTPDLTGALHRIAELEAGASESAKLLTFALDRLAKLEERVTRCPTSSSLLTPTSSPRRPRRKKGALCKFGHSAAHHTLTDTTDSEHSAGGKRFAPTPPPPPRRRTRRPPPYKPRQVKPSSVLYPSSPPASCAPPLFLPRSAHDILPADLVEEQEITSPLAAKMHRPARRSSPDLKLRAVESRAGPGEDEAAAAAADVCKLLVAEVVHAEQQQFVKNMVDVLQELEGKYSAGTAPAEEEEDGVTRSPTLPRITVDFARVRGSSAGLPRPELFALQGCSEEPEFYAKCASTFPSRHGLGHNIPHECRTKFDDVFQPFPFGSAPGFRTNLGIIAPPDYPIGGYVYSGGTGKDTRYVLAARGT